MICLPARLPLLQIGSRELTQYEAGWLEQSIRSAADRAGHEKWFFAADVAAGVIEYLRERFPGSAITADDLVRRIRRTLESLGFPDIAQRLVLDPPPPAVSLADAAYEAGPGGELFFYGILDRKIEEIRRAGVRQIRFTGMKKCLRSLESDRARRDARRSEVLDFLRHRAERASDSLAFEIR